MTTTLTTGDFPYVVPDGDTDLADTIYWPGFGGGKMTGAGRGDFTSSGHPLYGDVSRFMWTGTDNEPMIDLRSYAGQLAHFMCVGAPYATVIGNGLPLGGVAYGGASAGILLRKETILAGSGGAGKMSLCNIGLVGCIAGLQFGTTQTEAQSDITDFKHFEFKFCDYGVLSKTQNALNMRFTHPTFRDTPIGFRVEAGGNWVIDSPTVLTAGHTLLDFTNAGAGIGQNNGNYTITNLKVDNQYDDCIVLDMSAQTVATFTFVGGVIANETYAASGNKLFNLWNGNILNLHGFAGLQNGTVTFNNKTTGTIYHEPIINMIGCRMEDDVAQIEDIFDLAGSTGSCLVNVMGCTKILHPVPYKNKMIRITA